MPTTGSGKFRYPNSSDTPDVPGDILNLATDVARVAGAGIGYVADSTERAALVTNGYAFSGMFVLQADTGVTYRYTGSAWKIWDYLSGAQTYTPTIDNWNSATTPPTTTGRYWRTGDIMHVFVQSKLGTGSISVSNITVSLPVAMDTTGMISDSTLLNGTVCLNDVSSANTFFVGAIRYVDANTVRVMRSSASNPGQILTISASAPFTWQPLDEISLAFSYPIA